MLFTKQNANIYGNTFVGSGSKIIFTSGSQDPWQYATKQTTTSYGKIPFITISLQFRQTIDQTLMWELILEPALVIECENCGHCVDLSGCPQFPFNPQGMCHPHKG